MPPQRIPLGLISGNRLRNFELSLYSRGQVTSGYILGSSPAAIALGLNLSKSTVWDTIHVDSLRVEGHSRLRNGRPKEYSDRDECVILRHVRLFLKDMYAQVIEAIGVGIKKDTIKRILKHHGITNWCAKRRPTLTDAYVAKRLAWCLRNKGWSLEEWGIFM